MVYLDWYIVFNFKVKIFTPIFSRIYSEIIYGGHFTALSSPAIIITIAILLNQNIRMVDLLIAYLIPLIVYSYDYYKDQDKDNDTDLNKLLYLNNKKKSFIYIFIFYIFILFILLILLSNINFIIYVSILIAGGLLYSTIFKVLTRTVPGFKSIYITLVWSYACTLYLLLLYNNLTFSLFFLFIFTFVYLKGFINVVFFDIKDMKSDSKKNLKTLPIIIGKTNTYILLNIINISALILIFIGIYTKILPLFGMVLSIFFIYTSWYIYKGVKADETQILKYTYIFADAEFILWPIVLFVGKMLFIILLL